MCTSGSPGGMHSSGAGKDPEMDGTWEGQDPWNSQGWGPLCREHGDL